jgi:hypothetical protein
MLAIVGYVLVGLATLLLLGFCRHCYYLPKQFFRCEGCGATRPELDMRPGTAHPYTQSTTIYRTLYRCDGPTEKCKQGYMVLVVRRPTWWLTRPFAWMWAPFPAVLDVFSKIVSWKP